MQQEIKRRNFVNVKNTAILWREYAHLAKLKKLRKNEVLLRAGDLVDNLYFLHSGEVRMDFLSTDGREKVLLYMGENTFIGEVLFFLEQPCRATFTCTKPSIIWVFSRDCVFNQILPNSSMQMNDVFYTLASKTRILYEQVITMALDDVSVRYCKFLHLHSQRTPGGKLVAHPPLNKQELANLLGVHRISLYKAVKELENQGVIKEQERNVIFINDEKQFFSLLENLKDRVAG